MKQLASELKQERLKNTDSEKKLEEFVSIGVQKLLPSNSVHVTKILVTLFVGFLY